jgi:hypothetical protein
MTFILTNGNHIKVHKVTDIGFNRTYIDFTVYQKDGYWRHNEKTSFKNSMYDNITEYLEEKYNIK